jgi:putative addiction module CopG family antidote
MPSQARPDRASARTAGGAIFFAVGPLPAILPTMNAITLPPDLERFADDIVAQGRFRDVAEVVAAGVSLLQRAEAERAAFIASLEAAEAESIREGWHSLDDVLVEMDQIIAAKREAA